MGVDELGVDKMGVDEMGSTRSGTTSVCTIYVAKSKALICAFFSHTQKAGFLVTQLIYKLELMFMKHYAPNRCLYIKVAKLRTGVGSAEMSHLQNHCLKISG